MIGIAQFSAARDAALSFMGCEDAGCCRSCFVLWNQWHLWWLWMGLRYNTPEMN